MEKLLDECDACKGSGKQSQEPLPANVVARYGPTSCPKCNGRGKLLTEAGRAVKEVIEHVQDNGMNRGV